MSVDVSLSGWVGCDDKQLEEVKRIISEGTHEYQKAWVMPGPVGSWVSYVFFGADIHEYAVEDLRAQIQAIAEIRAEHADEHVTGVFFVHHEMNGATEWLVKDGKLIEAPGSKRYAYLWA
ncbi:MAG TPA: hypothetical protein VLF60_01775 [Candidatus Saccharimonadales bacterium]|nr:hypothetical protein [Candidatus Saccharimonadales bacterium]